MGFTREQVGAAILRQKEIARTRGEARMLRDGAVDYRIDATLFHNARLANKRVYGVENCWAEKEFVNDMVRRHPEIAVKNVSGKIRVTGFGQGRRRDEPRRFGGRLTRFGRVTFHKAYGG